MTSGFEPETVSPEGVLFFHLDYITTGYGMVDLLMLRPEFPRVLGTQSSPMGALPQRQTIKQTYYESTSQKHLLQRYVK